MAIDAAEGKTVKKSGGNKRSAFMAKLYDDEALIDDEMKVFDMNTIDDQDNEEEGKVTSSTKRSQKETEKKLSGKSKVRSSEVSTNKINRLKFNIGSLGLFAISEVHPTYLIVNYTRNTKGYISLSGMTELADKLRVG